VRLWRRWPVLERVIVNTRSGLVFRGVLAMRRRDYVVIRAAQMVKGTGEVVPVDGEVLVERTNLDFIQIL